MRLATPDTRPADDAREPEGRCVAARSCRARSRRLNHWASRDPDDFVCYPRLTPLGYLEESKLIERAKAGETAARNQLWMQYARLTLSVVNLFRVPEHLLADAIQEGCIGLTRAIAKFEVERFNSFSTYAWAWIYNGIQRFVADNVLPLRLPAYLFPEYMRFRRELRACKEPGDEAAVMERWHRDNPRLLSLMLRAHAVILGVPLHLLENGEHPFALDAEHAEAPDWKSLCLDAIRGLHERERIVIVKRYGLFGCPDLTLQQVADELQLTRERVRQIQEKAEGKLRRHCNRIRHLVDLMGQPDDAEEPTED